MHRSSKGFSLIELLIVVAIILVIAAIAVPNFLRSRVAANQASAVASLHTLGIAEATYASTFGQGYSINMLYLASPSTAGASPTSTAAGLIDSALASGTKSGYSFDYSPGAADTTGRINNFNFTAVPITSSTGTNYYYTDESGVIRVNATTNAVSTDSPVGG
ncbi:MAG TPA: prepilin-type N-terminal cleavage/methylation domain-containing protein [Terriglobia bacterium]|nr:prepilin-type N-terminal cleavage/methylation domain-containing protein [Terriglobia bacterium]